MLIMDLAPGVASTDKFDKSVHTWRDIPGWFQWRQNQEEALGRSICSLGEVVRDTGLGTTIIGVDTARGSGPEGRGGDDALRRGRRPLCRRLVSLGAHRCTP